MTITPAHYPFVALDARADSPLDGLDAPEALRHAYAGRPLVCRIGEFVHTVTLDDASRQAAEYDAITRPVGAHPGRPFGERDFWSRAVRARRRFYVTNVPNTLAFLKAHDRTYVGYLLVSDTWYHVGYDSGYDEYVIRDVTLNAPREHMLHYFYEEAFAGDDYATTFAPDAFTELLHEHPFVPRPAFVRAD